MKTSLEIDKLLNSFLKSEVKWRNAIINNLKESGKEYDVYSDNEDEEHGQSIAVICSGFCDVDAVTVSVDKIRWNEKHNIVEVHVCEENYSGKDLWYNIEFLGDADEYVLRNIDWES